MRSLVVYESWFGNTRRIAEEMAAALAHEGEVDLVTVDEPLPPLEDVDLLVVGAPTHIHGLSSKRARARERSPRAWAASRCPLEDGELERASEWGRTLANGVMSPTA